jgi:hypothetical protein
MLHLVIICYVVCAGICSGSFIRALFQPNNTIAHIYFMHHIKIMLGYIFTTITPRRISWVGHVIRTGITKNACKNLNGKSQRKIPFVRHKFMLHDQENLLKKKE